jgi:hypothetical protein
MAPLCVASGGRYHAVILDAIIPETFSLVVRTIEIDIAVIAVGQVLGPDAVAEPWSVWGQTAGRREQWPWRCRRSDPDHKGGSISR